MSEKGRVFTEAEITTARTMLTLLAHESVLYWAKALMSPSFMHEGKTWYFNSDFYKNSRWKDDPNPNAKPISGEQIIAFEKSFMEKAEKEIEEKLKSDKQVALLLYDKRERVCVHGNELMGLEGSFMFGGWDNDPFGIVSYAMTAAGIKGAMRVNSEFRKTYIALKKGEIILKRMGGWQDSLKVIYTP